ncbi:hypothetical protein BDY19DRAFT_916245 [Irpex rosettiformis]|uniref:Uncharacterized protein n=1 Tax=Irpex rosettiformis TaxID=378272 RepID=A0ACB8UL80_9APHY|nr:hypothetical protein BDY19DRAFT_916245 [Irpex rosettiformis]
MTATYSTTTPFRSETPAQRPHTAQAIRATATPAPLPARPPTLADDYERWYTEPIPNNRMVLALRSGIDSEVSWALERLCRLCHNEQFILNALPGLTEALVDWPSWYVKGGYLQLADPPNLFATSKDMSLWTRHALECMFILRNASCNPVNAQELVGRRTTQELILLALHRLKPDNDIHVQFLLDIVELLQSISSTSVLPPPDSHVFANPVPPLLELAGTSTDRALILSSLETLNLLFSNPPNVVHLSDNCPAFRAAIRYLPLVNDKPLIAASVNYIYTHLSHPPMTKEMLLADDLSTTLRLLVLVMLAEQEVETVSLEIPGPIFTTPAREDLVGHIHHLTQEEFDRLLPMQEPQRCYEWMKLMFDADEGGELTQVEFWNLYKDVFAVHQERCYALPASEVIKNVSLVFPSAMAMVLPGPPQRFVVRGVSRRRDNPTSSPFQCRWNGRQCSQLHFESSGDLYEHILDTHVNPHPEPQLVCSWSTCSHGPLSKPHIRGHILTHLPPSQQPPIAPGQDVNITLPYEGFPHPVTDPTTRPVPPLRSSFITFSSATKEPSSIALTALLCIRVLFRAAFASSGAAPRADEDHFGFPGIVEEVGEKEDDDELVGNGAQSDHQGEVRGRKAFVTVRHLLEGVRMNDDTLMGWITEMVDAGLSTAT